MRRSLWKDNKFLEAIGKTLTKPVATSLIKNGKVHLTDCVGKVESPSTAMSFVISVESAHHSLLILREKFSENAQCVEAIWWKHQKLIAALIKTAMWHYSRKQNITVKN